MDLQTLKNRAILRFGNLHTSDPAYSNLDDYANEAVAATVLRVVRQDRQYAQLFRELQHRWYVATVDSEPGVALAEPVLAIERVYSFDDDGVTPPDDGATDRREVDYVTERQFEERSKSEIGYPDSVTLIGNTLYVSPTPTAAYVTNLMVRGLRMPTDMVSPTDKPGLNSQWHPAVLEMLCHILAREKNYDVDAEKYLMHFDRLIGEVVNPSSLLNRKRHVKVRFAGSPFRR